MSTTMLEHHTLAASAGAAQILIIVEALDPSILAPRFMASRSSPASKPAQYVKKPQAAYTTLNGVLSIFCSKVAWL